MVCQNRPYYIKFFKGCLPQCYLVHSSILFSIYIDLPTTYYQNQISAPLPHSVNSLQTSLIRSAWRSSSYLYSQSVFIKLKISSSMTKYLLKGNSKGPRKTYRKAIIASLILILNRYLPTWRLCLLTSPLSY